MMMTTPPLYELSDVISIVCNIKFSDMTTVNNLFVFFSILHVLCCKENELAADTKILNIERDEGVVYCWRVSK